MMTDEERERWLRGTPPGGAVRRPLGIAERYFRAGMTAGVYYEARRRLSAPDPIPELVRDRRWREYLDMTDPEYREGDNARNIIEGRHQKTGGNAITTPTTPTADEHRLRMRKLDERVGYFHALSDVADAAMSLWWAMPIPFLFSFLLNRRVGRLIEAQYRPEAT